MKQTILEKQLKRKGAYAEASKAVFWVLGDTQAFSLVLDLESMLIEKTSFKYSWASGKRIGSVKWFVENKQNSLLVLAYFE